jgi:outer membrane protein
MKKIIIITLIAFVGISTYAQKYAFIDSEYILSNIPSYRAAQEQLDALSADWQKEVEEKYTAIEKMYTDYQAEKVLLTEEMRQKREEAIIQKEREAKALQKQYFGPEGDLYNKREELMKPLQDEIYKTVKDIATEGNYAVIFDTSSGPSIFYSNPRYDKSDEVLQKLGFKN